MGVQHAVDVWARLEDLRVDEDLAVPARRAGHDLAVEVDGEEVVDRDLVEAEAVRLHQKIVGLVGKPKRNVPAREIVLALIDQHFSRPDQLVLDVVVRHSRPLPDCRPRPCSGSIAPGE
jgi:hypothetical protein